MNDQQVASYLAAHPDFFVKHSALLHELTSPNERARDISFADYQLDDLHNENQQLNVRLQHLIEVSEFNYHEQQKLYDLIIVLIKQDNKTAIQQVLHRQLPKALDLSESRLLIWQDDPLDDKQKQQILRYVIDRDIYCGPMNPTDSQLIFNKPLESVALLPIAGKHHGLLALSSADARFASLDISDILLRFLTNIISVMLEKHVS